MRGRVGAGGVTQPVVRHARHQAHATRVAADDRVRRLGAAAVGTTTAAHLEERVSELLRRSVVDDRVDARVEVRQTVPQDAHRLRHVININDMLTAHLSNTRIRGGRGDALYKSTVDIDIDIDMVTSIKSRFDFDTTGVRRPFDCLSLRSQ